MRARIRLAAITVVGMVVLTGGVAANAQDWLAAPSYFTHEPYNGHRVHQYMKVESVVHTPAFSRSVYRHTRSSLQVGDSADYYHAVDRYGEPVRPYGEWRFPYRPFSVPYPAWGPTYGGGYGYPYGGSYGPGYGGGPSWGPFGPSGVINGSGFPPPWNDGTYPDVRRRQLPPQPFPSLAPQFNIQADIDGDHNSIGD